MLNLLFWITGARGLAPPVSLSLAPLVQASSSGLGEEGQSVIEFVFSLPLILAMILILVKINTAIQMGIVNQQFSRAQALALTYNSPMYPELSKRYDRFQNTDKGLLFNHMVVGVSDNVATSGDYAPRAMVQHIARKGRPESAPVQAEPEERKTVRIRSSVTLCTQSNVSISREPLLPQSLGGTTAVWRFPTTAAGMDYCGGLTRFDAERRSGGGGS